MYAIRSYYAMADTLGIIGAGQLARHIAWMAASERDFERVYVYDKSFKAVQDFIHFVNERLPDLDVAICEDAMQVASHSEVIITATTSTEPVLPNLEDLLLGKTLIAVGSYKQEMQELPESVYRLIDQIWIDTDRAKIVSGDVKFVITSYSIHYTKLYDGCSNGIQGVLPSPFLKNCQHLRSILWGNRLKLFFA